jgi:ubiquitin C-terminal hydrolase
MQGECAKESGTTLTTFPNTNSRPDADSSNPDSSLSSPTTTASNKEFNLLQNVTFEEIQTLYVKVIGTIDSCPDDGLEPNLMRSREELEALLSKESAHSIKYINAIRWFEEISLTNTETVHSDIVDLRRYFTTLACFSAGEYEGKLKFIFDLYSKMDPSSERTMDPNAPPDRILNKASFVSLLDTLKSIETMRQSWMLSSSAMNSKSAYESRKFHSMAGFTTDQTETASASYDLSSIVNIDAVLFKDFRMWLKSNVEAAIVLAMLERLPTFRDKYWSAAKERLQMIEAIHSNPLLPGDKCYVISQRWWKVWSEFTGFYASLIGEKSGEPVSSQEEIKEETDLAIPPGPIDNSDLIQGKLEGKLFISCQSFIPGEGKAHKFHWRESSSFFRLYPKIVEGSDYIVLNCQMWNFLYSWYGGGPCIERYVVERNIKPSSLASCEFYAASPPLSTIGIENGTVEMFPFIFHVEIPAELQSETLHVTASLNFVASPEMTFQCLHQRIQDSISLLSNQWVIHCNQNAIQIEDNMDVLLKYMGFSSYQVLEFKLLADPAKCTNNEANSAEPKKINTELPGPPILKSDKDDALLSQMGDGLVGLDNLGNSCYLNSALQLLSSVKPFVDYMLFHVPQEADQGDWNLKSKKLVIAHLELLRDMWKPRPTIVKADEKKSPPASSDSSEPLSGSNQSRSPISISPQKLQHEVVSRFPNFAGTLQHDAQELLSALLDELHEQLNSVTKKPFVPFPEETHNASNKELADLWWKNHLLRENSAIVALFQGQFQSEIECLVCHNITKTFPPFLFLSVPLPLSSFRVLDILLVLREEAPMLYRVNVRRKGTLNDALDEVRKLDVRFEKKVFICAHLRNSYVFSLLKIGSPVQEIRTRDLVVVYEVDENIAKPTFRHSASLLDLVSPLACRSSNENMGQTPSDSGKVCQEHCSPCAKLYVMHRKVKEEWKLLGKRSAKYSAFGLPLVLTLVSKGMSNWDFYEQIYTQLTRMYDLSYLQMSPTSSFSMNMFKSKRKAGTDAPPGKSTQPRGILVPEEMRSYPFVLRYVDRTGKKCGKCSAKSDCTGCEVIVSKSISFAPQNHDSFALEWNKSVKLNTFDVYATHVSAQEERQDVENEQSQLHPITLSEVLSDYVEKEEMSGFFCKRCSKLNNALKRETIYRLPPILLIHLKRFSFDMNGSSKNNCAVQFPWENFDVSPFTSLDSPSLKNPSSNVAIGNLIISNIPDVERKEQIPQKDSPQGTKTQILTETTCQYDIVSFINHLGDFYGGHYITAIRKGQAWYVFDDCVVSEATASNPISSRQAYVLCLQRQDVDIKKVLDDWKREATA